MLCLTRRVSDEIVIGGNIIVRVEGIDGNMVRLSVDVPGQPFRMCVRKPGDYLTIAHAIGLIVSSVDGFACRLAVSAPREVRIDRAEIHEARKTNPRPEKVRT